MLTDALLDRTVIILSSYNGQTKTDPAFNLHKLGIKNALIGFIEQCKLLPLAQQLEHIAKEMKEKTGDMAAKIEHESSQKRTWTLVFTLAALALERKQNLPENHPEIVPIDKLLSGLSNGWVHGFGSIGLGLNLNVEAINNLIEGMKEWIQYFDINQGMQNKHEVLLALYAAACSLEEKLSSYRIIPKKFKDEMATIKSLIANKFNDLKNKLEEENRNRISNALQVLGPDEDPLYRQFKEQIIRLKTQQEAMQQKRDSFPKDKLNRLQELQLLLKKQEILSETEILSQFWEKYNTPEKFTEILNDLEIPVSERPGWQEYYNYQHGSFRQQFFSVFLTGSWGIPQQLGGIPSNTISVDSLSSKSGAVIQRLEVMRAEIKQQKLIPDEENPSQLFENIEQNLKVLSGFKKVSLELITEQFEKSRGGQASTKALVQVNSDIDLLKKNLHAQKRLVESLQNIYAQINKIKHHVDCSELEKTCEALLDKVVKTISYTEIPSDLPTSQKINTLSLSIDRAIDNVEGIQRSINILVYSKQKTMIELVTGFINSKENTFGHKLLLIFSPAYKKMFKDLKEATTAKEVSSEESSEKSFNKIKEILGLSDEHAREKEIKNQFKTLKEEAQKTLDGGSRVTIPVHN